MAIIRQGQMDAFREAAVRDFENSVFARLREFFPNHYRIFGDQAIRRAIHYGIGQAERHGFSAQRESYLYITMMLLLGGNFDSDVQLPWVTGILDDRSMLYASTRMDAFAEEALAYFDRIAGQDHVHINRALVRLHGEAQRIVAQFPVPDFEGRMHAELHNLYPQKYEAVRGAGIAALIRAGGELASGNGLSGQHGRAICTVLMFFLGTGFDTDPLEEWVTAILREPASDERSKIVRLYRESMLFLEKWLAKGD